MTVIIDGTNGITDVDGSAATPALTGTDTNTGIFFPAADTIAFSDGGTETMRIDSSGNVGIGTTTPSAKLNVISGSVAQLIIGFSGTSASYLDSDLIVFRSAATTERMRIDSAGRFTLSYQPFFYAYLNVAQTGYNPQSTGDAPVIYNATTTNTGSHYNTSTGKFTAPVAGNYIFYASAYSVGTTFSQNWLVVNGSRIIGTDWVHSSSNMSTGFWLIKLAANDTVGFHAYNGAVSSATIATNPEHTYFKGYLLS